MATKFAAPNPWGSDSYGNRIFTLPDRRRGDPEIRCYWNRVGDQHPHRRPDPDDRGDHRPAGLTVLPGPMADPPPGGRRRTPGGTRPRVLLEPLRVAGGVAVTRAHHRRPLRA